MKIEPTSIEGLTEVRNQLSLAAQSCGRSPESVHLLAVSKQQPVAAIRAVTTAGQRDFGESYVQEALAKMEALKDLNLCWHFIGQLQSNKTRPIAEHFQWVHTLDRDKHATRLNEQRPHYAPPLQVCIQVKLAEEADKGGLWPNQVLELARHIQQLPRLQLRGLMCIPPPSDDYTTQLAQFQQMTELLAQLQALSHPGRTVIPAGGRGNTTGLELDTLSMGMSGDYAAAIAAGATWVRIGTAIFGGRHAVAATNT